MLQAAVLHGDAVMLYRTWFKRFKDWLAGHRYYTAVDTGVPGDATCVATCYIDRDGVIHLVSVEFS